eukprot:TRINITY_DN707_c0_g1_i8.p1 TRINITY_DN707_c0_g1~~TRINITY_DN707_c0_g1_i8.p1  ORF type:complete len:216 (+),score=28.21 TRINITY_DN707_c0_g1_i8:442-1089(+)
MFGSKYNPGIVPMVLDSLFESIAKAEQGQWEYSVEVSFMEIYNETVKDLFEENHRVKSKPVYRVKNSPGKGVQVEGVTKLALMSAGDVKDAMSRGVESRSMRDARMGPASSRSHMILQIDLTATNPVLKKQRHSRINLVGLAGSERIKMSCSGVTLHHAVSMNLSLTTLRRVVDTLTDVSSKKIAPRIYVDVDPFGVVGRELQDHDDRDCLPCGV